jgi:hypothetical protein
MSYSRVGAARRENPAYGAFDRYGRRLSPLSRGVLKNCARRT